MKNITVTFNKGVHQASCVLRYWEPDWPIDECIWSGDVEAFRMENGELMDPSSPLDDLENHVAFLSSRTGSKFSIYDDGGEAQERGAGKLIFTGMVVDTYITNFKKGNHQASCDLRYWGGADQPMRTEWTGDEEAYRLPDGSLFKFRFPQETLERELASQAEQIGAEFTMTHRSVTLE